MTGYIYLLDNGNRLSNHRLPDMLCPHGLRSQELVTTLSLGASSQLEKNKLTLGHTRPIDIHTASGF